MAQNRETQTKTASATRKQVLIAVGVVGVGILLAASWFNLRTPKQTVALYDIALTNCGVLNQAGKTYQLQNDVTSQGSCFSIQADNITLDLNNHTVTYDSQINPVIPNNSFENGTATAPAQWDMSKAPNVQRVAGQLAGPATVGQGNYSLAFQLPSAASSVTSDLVTLTAGKRYLLSTQLRNLYDSSVPLYMEVLKDTGEVIGRVDQNSATWGIFWYRGITIIPTENMNVRIRLGIENAQDVSSDKIYFDDVRIQTVGHYGVYAGACWAPNIYDNACDGPANNFVLKQGTIQQGAGNGFKNHAIAFLQGGAEAVTLDHVTVRIKGPSTHAVFSEYHSGYTIHDSIFDSAVDIISNRHQMEGAIIKLENGGNFVLYNNRLTGGAQGGIYVAGGSGGAIYNNDIRQNGRYSNDFSIYAHNADVEIYNNVIQPVSGRGIHLTNSNNRIHDNTITVTELRQNAEYDGCEAGGAYGIQLEIEGIGGPQNNEVYNNTVVAIAGECDAKALRVTGDHNVSTSVNRVHDNIFRAERQGPSTRSAIAVSSGGYVGALQLTNNTFYGDTSNVGFDWDGGGLTFGKNTFRKGDNPAADYATFSFWNSYPASLVVNDPVYVNGAENALMHMWPVGFSDWVGQQEIFFGWPVQTTVVDYNGVPLADVVVRAEDANHQVVSGTTDAQGISKLTLLQQRIFNTAQSATNVAYLTPHSISYSKDGYETVTQSLIVEAPQTLVIQLRGVSQKGIPCTSEWDCSGWSECSAGQQTRTCTDLEACPEIIDMPATIQNCFDSAQCNLSKMDYNASGEIDLGDTVTFGNFYAQRAMRADVHTDGIIDDRDKSCFQYHMGATLPFDLNRCNLYRMNYNNDSSISMEDTVIFTQYYFGNDPRADVNDNGFVNRQDLICFQEFDGVIIPPDSSSTNTTPKDTTKNKIKAQ